MIRVEPLSAAECAARVAQRYGPVPVRRAPDDADTDVVHGCSASSSPPSSSVDGIAVHLRSDTRGPAFVVAHALDADRRAFLAAVPSDADLGRVLSVPPALRTLARRGARLRAGDRLSDEVVWRGTCVGRGARVRDVGALVLELARTTQGVRAAELAVALCASPALQCDFLRLFGAD
jgi:hypothetical protein